FLKEIEPLKHEVGTCYRCHSTIEPMVSKQWFVKMEPLAKPAIESVEKGEIKFVPERFTKNYINWMKGTRDWCISRQLWWGHQIPAFYCDDCGETVVAKEMPCTCPKCGGSHFTQDPDTLDTWFSSALWPFSTLGWPNEDSADLKYFYPTNTLVTGYDIIGFWVSRMIFSGLAYTGKAPFDTVCIHGIVRDSQGRKMSKSLGNGIDPLEVIAQYGADALRFMLLDGSTPGNDMRYSEKKVEAARNFANKLWNATRFVLMNLPEDFQPGLPEESKLDMSDKWVLTKLNQVAGAMTDNLDHYEMGLAAAKINSFIWDVYCDWFIEIAKPRLNSGDAEQADTARRVLVYVLDKALKLLHPFMPFITEELYQALPGSAETIMTQSWPTFDEAHNWAEEEEAFEKVMDYIKAVRTMRTEMNVHPAKKTSMIIETADPAPFRNAEVYLAKFAFATDVTFTEKYEGSTDGMVQVSTHTARGFIPMMELIDREKELARLNKEKAKAEKELAMFENQLANPKFVERAPAALVEEIRAKRTNSQSKLANIEQSIKALG
uniref:valine--tRNA ligase n=2 Tax=Faecalibacterium sp. TaxID=1971605 RepID=UPI003FF12B4D